MSCSIFCHIEMILCLIDQHLLIGLCRTVLNYFRFAHPPFERLRKAVSALQQGEAVCSFIFLLNSI